MVNYTNSTQASAAGARAEFHPDDPHVLKRRRRESTRIFPSYFLLDGFWEFFISTWLSRLSLAWLRLMQCAPILPTPPSSDISRWVLTFD